MACASRPKPLSALLLSILFSMTYGIGYILIVEEIIENSWLFKILYFQLPTVLLKSQI